MWLLIDAGNTRIKWAMVASDAAPGVFASQGMVEHGAAQQAAPAWHGATGVWIANVAGPVVRAHLSDTLDQALPGVARHWFASRAEAGGLRNHYREPTQLGCDRFAAAIGAHALFPGQNLLVANCGTATTLDAISADGVFLGGMILPGLGTMAKALNRQTAQLPDVQYQALDMVQLADNTADAIVSGCIAAQTGAIRQGVDLMQARQSGPVLCILSGGAASIIGAALAQAHQIVDHLVLHGLQVVAPAMAGQGEEITP